jgi:hypothetical protein
MSPPDVAAVAVAGSAAAAVYLWRDDAATAARHGAVWRALISRRLNGDRLIALTLSGLG